eukprot:m.258766 g.258766  ORF g.258766 m.258766 type:complete len:73 (-) comp26767_c0_seq7:23-241(-)
MIRMYFVSSEFYNTNEVNQEEKHLDKPKEEAKSNSTPSNFFGIKAQSSDERQKDQSKLQSSCGRRNRPEQAR